MSSALVTAEDLLGLHEPGFRHELVDGVVQRMSAAGFWHGIVVARLTGFLAVHVARTSLGEVLGAETGFLLARDPDTVLAPDVAFVRSERLPREPMVGYFVGPPDLAVEVTSPSDTAAAVRNKAHTWLAHGVRLVWVLEPKKRRAIVYREHGDGQVRSAAEVLDGGDVVPGFTVIVDALFPRSPEAPA